MWAERWDGPLRTRSTPADAAAYLRIHGFSEAAAMDSAATLRLPLTLTMRGCVAYAAKASAAP